MADRSKLAPVPLMDHQNAVDCVFVLLARE